MSEKKAKFKITSKHNDAIKFQSGEFTLTLREIEESKDGYSWSTWLVQGWKEKDKWQRRKFKEKQDAETFIYRKQIELQNVVGSTQMVVTRLTEDQVRQAEEAFRTLGNYSLKDAVDFFLQHFCDPDFKITIEDAIRKFLEGKEGEAREVSIGQLDSVVSRFGAFVQNCYLHDVGVADVERFLKSIRAKNGVDPASKKTWNNYRADLSSFFNWCIEPQRRWINFNPASPVTKHKGIDRDLPAILSPKEAQELMTHVAELKEGALVRYFALALFAGIRTGPKGEIAKLARHKERDKLIDLKRGVIHIPREVSKTKQKRQIVIRDNLKQWLLVSSPEILPTNHDRLIKSIRKKYSLSHDILRHSFFSYHVAAFRSVGDAAIEGGNTEAIIKKHYLNLATKKEGKKFWNIQPKENL